MSAAEIPQRGTRDYEMWIAGATAEREASREGMSKSALSLFDCVQPLAEHHRADAPEIARWLAIVFTCEQPLRWRLRLAWRIARGFRRSRGWKVYFELRDWWIGYYRGDTHHYVCPLPCVVIRWNRRPAPQPDAEGGAPSASGSGSPPGRAATAPTSRPPRPRSPSGARATTPRGSVCP